MIRHPSEDSKLSPKSGQINRGQNARKSTETLEDDKMEPLISNKNDAVRSHTSSSTENNKEKVFNNTKNDENEDTLEAKLKLIDNEKKLDKENEELHELNECNQKDVIKFKEGGWGWIVAIACAFCFGFNVGVENTYTLFYNEFINVYNETENHVVYSSWIGSTSYCIQFLFCSVSAMLISIFDARKIGIAGGTLSSIGLFSSAFIKDLKLYFLTYGVCFGLGQALLLAAMLSILPHYFNKRLGFANGLMNFGATICTISLPFIISESLSTLKLRKTFFILSAFSFGTALCAFTFKSQLPKTQFKSENKLLSKITKTIGLELFKKKKFLLWITSAVFAIFGFFIPIVTISHYGSLLFPNEKVEILSAILGAASGISGIIFGKISDSFSINAIYFHVLAFTLGGITQISIIFVTKFFHLCIIMAFYGIVDGLYASFIVPVSCEVSNSHTLANQATGYFFAFIAFPALSGPALAGYIYEKYNNYTSGYIMGGSSMIFAGFFLLLLYPKSFLCVKKIIQ